jgi:hypothetical protein
MDKRLFISLELLQTSQEPYLKCVSVDAIELIQN